MTLLKWLDHIDKILFVLISHDTDHSILDKVMPVLRDPITWIPFYVFMLYYAIRKRKSQAWAFILLSVLTVAITDSLTAQVLKPLFGRLRPCYDPELSSVIRGLVDCGGLYSMPSNHAANHFGLAAFWYFSIKKISGKKWKGLWVWAAAICYAQIYVGKHFPFDILAGALTGFLTGLGMSRLFEFWESRQGNRSSAFTLLFKKSPEKPVEI
ncbi:MAG TPA: phosphatase PAP2 family protein [Puia sp.]|nr:phosphatase PAP2 family protein [Puia sp.]